MITFPAPYKGLEDRVSHDLKSFVVELIRRLMRNENALAQQITALQNAAAVASTATSSGATITGEESLRYSTQWEH